MHLKMHITNITAFGNQEKYFGKHFGLSHFQRPQNAYYKYYGFRGPRKIFWKAFWT